jgi:hypothetical protein
MEKTIYLTDALNILGLNPTIIYSLTAIFFLLWLCRRIEEDILFPVFYAVYVPALTLTGDFRSGAIYTLLAAGTIVAALQAIFGAERVRDCAEKIVQKTKQNTSVKKFLRMASPKND